jgi:hypothetical protein
MRRLVGRSTRARPRKSPLQGYGTRLATQQEPYRDRQKEQRRPVLPHPAARDAPDAGPEGIHHRKAERGSRAGAKPLQAEEQKEDRERADSRRRYEGELVAIGEEIDPEQLARRIGGEVQEPRQDRIGRDDPAVHPVQPVRKRNGRIDVLGEVEVAVAQQGDRQELGRRRVAAADVAKPDEIDRQREEERGESEKTVRPGLRRAPDSQRPAPYAAK